MSEAWEMTVQLVATRSSPDDPIIAVGTLDRGALPKEPTTVIVFGRESVTVVHGAHEADDARMSVREGLHALALPGIHRAAVARGSRIEPSGDRSVQERPPRAAFGRLSTGQRVGLAPDYGGVIFATPFGMADVDALAHRIAPSLQDALWAWYLEWDESTSTGALSQDEFVAEGERLVRELNAALGGECEFHLNL